MLEGTLCACVCEWMVVMVVITVFADVVIVDVTRDYIRDVWATASRPNRVSDDLH